MKKALSISLGSSKRDHTTVIKLLDQEIELSRFGTDGDVKKAKELFRYYDGKVDCMGLGGMTFKFCMEKERYLRSAFRIVKDVKQTPVVDGANLKRTLEGNLLQYVKKEFNLDFGEKTCFLNSAVDRYSLATSFQKEGFEITFGDFMFILGLPFPVKKLRKIEILAAVLMPLLSIAPVSWLYPTGKKQERSQNKYANHYAENHFIAGDFLYIKQYMPPELKGKIIVTNTTTAEDVETLRKAGVSYLITSTPVLEGRSFGTNVFEAALVAASGEKRVLETCELEELLKKINYKPRVEKLN